MNYIIVIMHNTVTSISQTYSVTICILHKCIVCIKPRCVFVKQSDMQSGAQQMCTAQAVDKYLKNFRTVLYRRKYFLTNLVRICEYDNLYAYE